jgi:phosphatidylserine decarboxylase
LGRSAALFGRQVVGSISFLDGVCEEGARVTKGDCHGVFGFGGSTVLLFFQPGTVVFDPDLAENSSAPVETLVRMGESIGKAPH